MYEKITSFVDFFENNAVSEGELKKQIEKFANAFMESEFMHLNAMEEMGDRMFAGKSALKEAASTMTADEIFVCLSTFIQQDAFIPGILQDLIQQDVIPKMLKRLKELDH